MYKQDYEYQDSSLTSRARSNFVTKVFSIVGIQLLATTLMVALNMYSAEFAKFQIHSSLFYWASIIGAIGSCLILCTFFFNL